MKRRLLNFLTALSLLLCLAASLAWWRSRSNLDRVYWLRPAAAPGGAACHVWRASVYWGSVELTYDRFLVPPDGTSVSTTESWARAGDWGLHWLHFDIDEPSPESPPPDVWRRLGFGLDPSASPSRIFAFPLWVLVVALAAAPGARGTLLAARAWQARARRGVSRCAACGYDLRATPDRCPECGTPAATFD